MGRVLGTLAHVEGGRLRLFSRRGNELAPPGLEPLVSSVPAGTVLDGELVVLGPDGHPDFESMRWRAFAGRRSGPALYVAFDVLYYAGSPTTVLPWAKRRALLDGLST